MPPPKKFAQNGKVFSLRTPDFFAMMGVMNLNH